MPFFTEWTGASSFEVILARQPKHSSTGTPASGTLGPRCISLILPRRRSQRKIRLCRFCTLIDIVSETAIVSFRTLPVGFPLPTISKTSLYTLFCSLILEVTAFVSKFPFLASKFLIRRFCSILLLPFNFLQSVTIKSCCPLMNLHTVQFLQYGLEFLRLSYS